MNIGPSFNTTGPDRQDDGSHPHPSEAGVLAFVALNLAGGVGLVLVLITAALSRKVKRNPTWYSFCFSWVFYAVSYSLLFLAGEQTNPTPPYSLCSTQAALIYALPPTTSCTTLALLLHVLLSIPDVLEDTHIVQISIGMSLLLLLGPYTIFLVIFVGKMLHLSKMFVATQSGNILDTVQKVNWGTYCESADRSWSVVSYAVVAVVTLTVILVQSRIIIQLHYQIPNFNLRSLINHNSRPVANGIRAILFTLIWVTNLVMAALIVAFTTGMRNLKVDLILATFPLLTFLVFGLQKDLMQCWISWRTPRPSTDTNPA